MFAVIKSGGKQYKVAKDDIIAVEKLEAEVGATVKLGEVLMIGDGTKEPTCGAPLIAGASVETEVVRQGRTRKILVFKKKRRHNYRRKNGHRQAQTFLRIGAIKA